MKLLCFLIAFISVTSQVHSNLDIIKAYLQARQQSMQQNATNADIEKLMSYYSDCLYYEHILSPQKKFIFHTKDDLRNGYTSPPGETKNVKIVLVNHVEKQNIIIAKHTITREVISTGKIENYKIVSIYELNEEGKIIHVTDYL